MRDLLFCGENREASLTRLIRAYDDVAAAAEGLRPGKEPGAPVHRVVLIHAERGLGKTRLALELYRHLATMRDAEGYWPDDYDRLADRVAVMPQAAGCNYDARPSFLWWGMAIPDGPNPGSTLFNSLEDLLTHLTAIQLAARRDRSGREAAAELLDLAVDAGIELTGDAFYLGTAKRLGAALWKAGAILRRHAGETTDPLKQAAEQLEPVVDGVLDDLGRMFAPRSRLFAGRPLVILVDDAQFADRDQAMAAFLERLIARSARERWPLLLILTHWSRQLHRRQDAAGTWHPPSHAARVLIHARDMAPTNPGVFAGQGGGTLDEASYVEIDLSEPVTDLTPALTDRFPGLSGATATALIELSGNNPRKLEQIVAAMTEWPAWFEDVDFDNDLTEDGRREVLALSRRNIDDIVAQRFGDTPAHVRRALTLAGLIGSRFVVELVERLSQARFAEGAKPGLVEGERPYRFVRGVAERTDGEVGAFAERLFFDAAVTYWRSGKARQNLTSWPTDKELMEGLDGLLGGLVEDPASVGGLSETELALALAVAADRMITGRPEMAGLALARLVRLENGRGNYEGANAAAVRFIAGFAP